MLSNLATRDVETLIHPYTQLASFRETGPLVLERGEGIWVYDSEGRGYIEGMAGLWCTALGYSNVELVEAAREQMLKLPFSHLFSGRSHDPAIELAERLKEMAPMAASKIFFCSSGSEANDTQMKLVWYMNNALGRPKKKKFVSRVRGYHGVTIASASLTGLPANHIDFDLPIANVLHTSCPHYYRFGADGESEAEFSTRMAQDLDDLIQREGPDTVAAFIAEPVMGAGGVILPPEGYFEKIQAVLDRYEILFIADEVITGFGRLGTAFGSQRLGIRPDTVSFAKAVTSGYLPLGGVMIPEPMYQAMLDESRKVGTFGHGTTYSGHPVPCAVANKTLEIYKRDQVFEAAAAKAPLFEVRLRTLEEHPLVGHARGLGLVGGFEIVADKRTKAQYDQRLGVAVKLVGFAQAEGLIVRSLMGDRISICPPLVISEAEIDELFRRLTRALDRTADWLVKEGLRPA